MHGSRSTTETLTCIKHGVRFVQHQPPDVAERQVALRRMLQHTLRRAHQQVDGPLQRPHLRIPPATCRSATHFYGAPAKLTQGSHRFTASSFVSLVAHHLHTW